MEKYRLIAILNFILRIPFLFLIPIAMFGDGLARFIPRSYQVIKGDLFFYENPLFFLLEGSGILIFSGETLEFFWKLVPFLFFILSLFLLPEIYEILKLNKKEKSITTALFLFYTWSLLSGESIMLESMITFFTFSLFIIVEKVKEGEMKYYFLIMLITAIMFYSKQTSYFIIAGFYIFVLFKKTSKINKIGILISMTIGIILFIPWPVKNYVWSVPNPQHSIKEFIITPLLKFIQDKSVTLVLIRIREAFHSFWFIPWFSQVNFYGFFYLIYLGYYLSFFISSLIITMTIVAGMMLFGKKYKNYLLLITPLLGFDILWTILSGFTHDAGRYFLSFYIFFCFFSAKFIESISNNKIRRFFYLIIIIFVILSLATAYTTTFRMANKAGQIKEIAEKIKNNNYDVVTNEVFCFSTLPYYSKKEIKLKEFKIENMHNKVLSLKDYQVFFEDNTFYILH